MSDPRRVVIAGGGVAGLETLIGLRETASERLELILVSREPAFTYRPLDVGEPFGLGHPRQYPLADLVAAQSATFREDGVSSVDTDGSRILTGSGAQVEYDALVLAVGARPVPSHEHGIVFSRGLDATAFAEVVGDVVAGFLDHVAVIVPADVHWTLPAYELALMTAAWGGGRTALTLITHESRPLEAFGPAAVAAVREVLLRADVDFVPAARAEVLSDTALRISPGGGVLNADRIVSLPSAIGPALPGLPHDAGGFIPVDRRGRVQGLDEVFAAGDGTNARIKQGGLAAQQADAIVAELTGDQRAHRTGFVLRGLLRTADGPLYLRAELGDVDGTSTVSRAPLWWPPSKIASRRLSPFLADLDRYEMVRPRER
jgi:sulfide:quinone oxidoreductase